jgi:hypothetical protein
MFEHKERNADNNVVYPRDAALAFAPDGKTLAWNQGQAVELWDVVRGRPIRRFNGGIAHVMAVAFSPRGSLLAVADEEGIVWLGDPKDGSLRGHIEAPRGDFYCLAFSPDGKTLYTGGSDTTVTAWEVAHVLAKASARPGPCSQQELEDLWKLLGSTKGTEAGAAMARLAAVPRQAVRFLRARLRPVTPVNAERVKELLAGLEDKRYAVRHRAEAELEKLAEQAEPFLRRRLKENPSVEFRQRAERLLRRLTGFVTVPEAMRRVRAVEVLEHLGTAEAQQVLKELAGGAPEARLTREAKAALERLARQPRAIP